MFKVYTLTDGLISNLTIVADEQAAHAIFGADVADAEVGYRTVEQTVVMVEDAAPGETIGEDALLIAEHTVTAL